MKFQIEKQIDLGFLGTGWEGCYIKVSAISIRESRDMAKMGISEESGVDEQLKASEFMMKILKDKFISGKGWDGTKQVDIKADELEELPPQVLAQLLTELTSGINPNA